MEIHSIRLERKAGRHVIGLDRFKFVQFLAPLEPGPKFAWVKKSIWKLELPTSNLKKFFRKSAHAIVTRLVAFY